MNIYIYTEIYDPHVVSIVDEFNVAQVVLSLSTYIYLYTHYIYIYIYTCICV